MLSMFHGCCLETGLSRMDGGMRRLEVEKSAAAEERRGRTGARLSKKAKRENFLDRRADTS